MGCCCAKEAAVVTDPELDPENVSDAPDADDETVPASGASPAPVPVKSKPKKKAASTRKKEEEKKEKGETTGGSRARGSRKFRPNSKGRTTPTRLGRNSRGRRN